MREIVVTDRDTLSVFNWRSFPEDSIASLTGEEDIWGRRVITDPASRAAVPH
jgi:hypothetical protein